MGHLLWTGIVSGERAERIAGHLVSPSMFSGWGVRTLSADNPGFNPLSYHCGSVWPHDTAIAVAGLARYGFDSEAQMLTSALVDTAIATDGRLPELFGGFDRTDIARPVPYPTACSPQAWSAATPLLLVRSMLGLEPDVPNGVLHVRPRLPPWIHELTMSDVQIGGRPIAITAQRDEAVVSVGPPDIRVVVS
jgi:glycogen debranching enzyme